MKTPKKYPNKQIEKFSTIFVQLGLVVSLTIIFLVLEHKTPKESGDIGCRLGIIHEKDISDLDTPIPFRKEVVKLREDKPIKKPSVAPDISEIEKITNTDTDTKETFIAKETEEKPFDIDAVLVVSEDDVIKEEDEPHLLLNVQNAPIFKGCEGLNEAEGRKCFDRKMKHHVLRNFDATLAQNLGMTPGKYRIFTQFIIDKEGKIKEVKSNAPNAILKKQAIKVVTKIPKFIPGMQNNRPVNVKYTLPITFLVE